MWATRADARRPGLWAGAPADDASLDHILAVAQEVAEAFAPALPAGSPVPARYTQGVVLLARDTWQAAGRGPNDTMGPDEYPVRIPALSGHVRSLLRPKTGRPRFGGTTTTDTTTILDGGAITTAPADGIFDGGTP